MYKFLRKKFAESINTVDVPEQFEWGKWLREPLSESLNIGRIISALTNYKPLLSFDFPEVNSFTFKTQKVKLYKSKRKFSLPRSKTVKVFFRLSHSQAKKINIFNTDAGKIIFSSSFDNEKLTNIILLKDKKGQEYYLDLTTSVASFDFHSREISLKEITFELSNSKSLNFETIIDKPAFDNPFNKISEGTIKPELLKEGILIAENYSNNSFQINYICLDEIPEVFDFEISNVNNIIEKLDKEALINEINAIPVQYLTDKPLTRKFEIHYIHFTQAQTYSLTDIQFIDDATVSNYEFLIKQADILEESSNAIFSNNSFEIQVNNYNGNPGDLKNISNICGANFKFTVDKEFINNNSIKETIAGLLTPEKIIPEKLEVTCDFLYSFQKEGAEFLANNKIAFLNDELGLGKTYQVISAVNALLTAKKCEKFLIICNLGDIGNPNFNDGWSGKLIELANEISFSIVQGDEKERKLIWMEEKKLFITDYKTLIKDFNNENINSKIIESFKCIIFDEAQTLILHKKMLSPFLDLQNSNTIYTWFLSGQINTPISTELKYCENLSIMKLNRTKIEMYDELPEVMGQDVWLELDDEQRIEYENTLALGQEKIGKLLQTANPFIIQSNVFTLLHQLKQLCNFASQKKCSFKTDCLLEQIETISKNNKKMIIFSQYDKMGIQKIEEVLKSAKIKYLLLHSGMSLHELEAAKRKFNDDKSIHVLLNGIKSMRSSIDFPTVQYLVHFDQWWNPATVWKMEESVNLPENENINVYNYFVKNTVEEKIKELLLKKGLLKREIVEFLSAETINSMISTDEWTQILEIGKNGLTTNELKKINKYSLQKSVENLSIDELGKKTEMLFSRLGFKNLFLNRGNLDGEINIIGTLLENNSKIKVVVKCLFSDQIDIENIMEYIEATQNNKNLGKNFIIHFNGLEDKLPYQLQKKIILINKELFTNYLVNFRLI